MKECDLMPVPGTKEVQKTLNKDENATPITSYLLYHYITGRVLFLSK